MASWLYLHLMDIALGAWIAACLVSLIVAQRRKAEFNLLDFVSDPITGKGVLDKLIKIGTWGFSTWIVLYCVQKFEPGSFTQIFWAYLGTWAGLSAVKTGADAYTLGKQQPAPPAGVTNVNVNQ